MVKGSGAWKAKAAEDGNPNQKPMNAVAYKTSTAARFISSLTSIYRWVIRFSCDPHLTSAERT